MDDLNIASVTIYANYDENQNIIRLGMIWNDEIKKIKATKQFIEENVLNIELPDVGGIIWLGPFELQFLGLDNRKRYVFLRINEIKVGACYASSVESNWQEWELVENCQNIGE